MEFEFKPNVKIVVDFEIGEKVLIKNFSPALNGEHTIEDFKTSFGHSSSGILVKVSGDDRWLDIGWISKLEPDS